MNYPLSIRTRLLASICIVACTSPMHAMQKQTDEEKRIQKLMQEKEDTGVIKGYFSSRSNLDKFIVSNNNPANPMWKKGNVDLVRRMVEHEGQSGTRLYEVHYSWQASTQSLERKTRKYCVRFTNGFWTQDIDSKKSEEKSMRAAGRQGLCPQVSYADRRTNGGFIVMDYIDNVGSAENVDWESQETYSSLGHFLAAIRNTPIEKPHRDLKKSWYYMLTESDPHRKGYIPQIVEYLEKKKNTNPCAEHFLNNGLQTIIQKIKEIHGALPNTMCHSAIHGDLHTGNLKPKVNPLTGERTGWIAFDWDHGWFTHDNLYDAAFVEATWVPKGMREHFWKAFWGNKQATAEEQARLNLLRAATALFFGIAFANSGVDYLATNFEELSNQSDLDQTAQRFMQNGFKLKTREECGTFGTALLIHGLQQTKTTAFEESMTMLNALQSRSHQ